MSNKQEEFYKELLADFKIEATEHSTTFTNNLLLLEKEGDKVKRQSMIEIMFREIHSLKGAARAVNLEDIERLCQSLESVLSLMKQGHLNFSSYLFDTFHNTINILNDLLKDIFNNQKTVRSEVVSKSILDLTSIINSKSEHNYQQAIHSQPEIYQKNIPQQSINLNEEKEISTTAEINKQVDVHPPDQINEEKTVVKETIRITTEKLSNILLQAEELITAKAIFSNFTQELKLLSHEINTDIKTTENKKQQIQPNGMIQEVKLWEELCSLQKENSKKNQYSILQLIKDAEQYHRSLSRMIDELLNDIKKTLLRPFSSLSDIFPKIVRDLSKEQHKEVLLNVYGFDIDIDRRILEEIKDPLIHIIRNCIDHGIEKPHIRAAKNKPSQATINISLVQTNDQRILIKISDDGQGIDKEKVIASAIKAGIINEETIKEIPERDLYRLILFSGVTSSSYITNISGRGLGMAIVADKVVQLGGTIDIDSIRDVGTTFTINLPLSLATFRGVIFKLGDDRYIVPTNTIERVLKIKRTDIKTVKNQETIFIDGEPLSLVQLSNVLGVHQSIKKNRNSDLQLHVLILATGKKRMAYLVDEIIGEQEGIIKSLGSQLVNVRHISGATILGDGKIVAVINVSELIDVSIQVNNQFAFSSEKTDSNDTNSTTQSILIVEDSLTSRALLRNILETAGYDVKIAVDGVEAYSMIKNENFDLIVSDIEMPRMNGFELTEKIRAEEQFSNLPIIIVTSLNSPEDRMRGMEVGANAYCVKSSFDQSNLLEIIQRLI